MMMAMDKNSEVKGFVQTSQSKPVPELEPATPAGRWEETLSLGKCLRVLGGKPHIHGCTYARIGPGRVSRVRMNSFKALWPMRTKTLVFFAPGMDTRVGQLPQSGQEEGLWFGPLARDSRGSFLRAVLFICKVLSQVG